MYAVGKKHSSRLGVAAVEFAMVVPVLFLLLLGLIEFSRGAMVMHTLEDAANRGCRTATCELGTLPSINQTVADVVATSGIDQYQVTVTPIDYPDVAQWEPVTVTVSAYFGDVSWLPVPRFLDTKTITGSATLPMETGSISSSSDWVGDRKKDTP